MSSENGNGNGEVTKIGGKPLDPHQITYTLRSLVAWRKNWMKLKVDRRLTKVETLLKIILWAMGVIVAGFISLGFYVMKSVVGG